MSERIPAEVFPPGEFIREELGERGWNQGELSEILGCPPRTVSEIINGKRSISPAMAKCLSHAFGTSAELWMNLESSYKLSKVRNDDAQLVTRRAALYSKVPLREMIRRAWIEESDSLEVLEMQICGFLGIKSIGEEPVFDAAARKSVPGLEATPAQKTWLWRARHLSEAVHAERFDRETFKRGLGQLRRLAANAEDVRRVPKALAELGVRFLVVEHLQGTKIDGVCFWLDSASPVVALSVRYDRIDNFWFTLGHELAHVFHGDRQPTVDCALDEQTEDQSKEDNKANTFASELLVDCDALRDFTLRVRPLYSSRRVEGFARRIGIHPGIVVGQLHHCGEIPPRNLRKMLVPIRSLLIESALTDGWGCAAPNVL